MADLTVVLAHLRLGLADPLRNGLGLLNLRFGLLHLGFGLRQGGGGGIDVLLAGRLAGQNLLAVEIGLSLHKSGLGRGELRLRKEELSREILARHIGCIFEARELTLCGGKRRLGRLAVDHILAVVDVNERIALVDELIVIHVERHNSAGNLRRYRYGAPIDIGIVRRLVAGVGQPIGVSGIANAEDEQDCQQQDERAAAAALTRLRLGAGLASDTIRRGGDRLRRRGFRRRDIRIRLRLGHGGRTELGGET